jgi:hypothetical protein
MLAIAANHSKEKILKKGMSHLDTGGQRFQKTVITGARFLRFLHTAGKLAQRELLRLSKLAR